MNKSIFLISYKLRTVVISAIIFMLLPAVINAQADRKYIRQGNREYEKNNFQDSEISYRRATDKNNESADAIFNTGNALYKQQKYEDAVKQYTGNHNMNEELVKKSASLYNMGNSLLMANKVQESIEAYKGALKLNPASMEAKYNLAYAQDLLQEQQQQQQQQDNKDKEDKEKDNNNEKDQDNQQNKSDNKEDQNPDPKQQQDQQQQQQQISQEDAERLLNALANDEKNVQEKVKLEKAMKAKVRTVKNW